MEKSKKIKLFIGLFYLLIVSLFLFYFFSKFSFNEITSYEFIKKNRDYFYELKQSRIYLFTISFIFFVIAWVLAAGFVSPIVMFAGFIFGKWLGLLISIVGLSIGSTCFYLFANYFLKSLIKEKFLNKFKNLEEKFKKSEFTYLLIYRFIGGIPFVISNVIPCMFNVKASNFFWATFLGIMPQVFLISSIGSGLDKIIDQNLETPGIKDIIFSPDIYVPIVVFIFLIIITIILRRSFYKN
jgi:uncharacterized membrane protein YdjX (TVP38/TMEM64 family)